MKFKLILFTIFAIAFSNFAIFSQNSDLESSETKTTDVKNVEQENSELEQTTESETQATKSEFSEQKENTVKLPTEDEIIFEEPDLNFNDDPLPPREKSYSLFFTMGPIMTINTEDVKKSAPSPIAFSCGFGAKLRQAKLISVAPCVSFFTNYYLWDGERALPAEVENRTATVLSFLVDLPILFNLRGKSKNYIEVGGGVAVLARYGILSNGIKSSDSGVSGDAAGDVEEINKDLMNFTRIIYPELSVAWNYKVNERFDAGLVGKIYIPISGNGLDTMMISVSARLLF